VGPRACTENLASTGICPWTFLLLGSRCTDWAILANKWVKVKCTLVHALRLCTGRTAHRGSRGIVIHFLNHDIRRGWGVSVTPRLLFTPGKDPLPIVQKAGWVPGPVWTGAEILASTGTRSPNRPARSQSLYRLRYRSHQYVGCSAILTFRRLTSTIVDVTQR